MNRRIWRRGYSYRHSENVVCLLSRVIEFTGCFFLHVRSRLPVSLSWARDHLKERVERDDIFLWVLESMPCFPCWAGPLACYWSTSSIIQGSAWSERWGRPSMSWAWPASGQSHRKDGLEKQQWRRTEPLDQDSTGPCSTGDRISGLAPTMAPFLQAMLVSSRSENRERVGAMRIDLLLMALTGPRRAQYWVKGFSNPELRPSLVK